MELGRIEAISRGTEDTQEIGRTLGAHAQPGHVFLLVGALGVGKTCLTQGVLWGLGGEEYARSPTYVLIAQYQARLLMHHIDLYRLDAPVEAVELGLDEYLYGDGLCVVEWADRVPGVFPDEHLRVHIERLDETTRRLTLESRGPDYAELLAAVKSRTGDE